MTKERIIERTTEKCFNCNGKGWNDTFNPLGKYLGKKPCPTCGGDGKYPLIIREPRRKTPT